MSQYKRRSAWDAANSFLSTRRSWFRPAARRWTRAGRCSTTRWTRSATRVGDRTTAAASGYAWTGNVYEPYLVGCARPDYLLPAYYQGRNLAESYYLPLEFSSWQGVVLGDAMCSLGRP